MRFDIITLFPEMFCAITKEGVIARGIKKSLLSVNTWQLRDFSDNKHRNIDDAPYGGGAGMVMQVKPIRDCIRKIKQENPNTTVVYLSPQGEKLDNKLVVELSKLETLTLLCGRYEGVDERIIDSDVDKEISIGDYVISGGELAAMVLIDTVSRQISGVLGNQDSLNDSFADGLLDYPHYTRPETIDGQSVPEVLLSGHQAKIDAWRTEQAEQSTHKKRPDLLKR
ncbi:tRNA (guanine(37)-N(1))-methyltransferase (EC 2.1.1.228) [uncultured Gammaproteobacteria bacterium]|jgi:tRNA (guanine37-N1)-methyltransferase|uniref:tRNA (guanine-N(1)-)-methyltransferase n=3 Tax=sulfur-oxidizing symbionts TaxID=32036 RepID=A0A1H6MDW3_9GAMM|nr:MULTISPECIES: tRNA (guanosine(37)-N1)-methyltransferase TrmD [sulfur-oxidizing symbionts]CAC9484319.1 tRNA (guanine(37)-N(1))-methyltransferase (EC 2.1.1.228) [uncultured Gammaproteobacteria bacterium]CAB5500833.1 tRNA (guanine(37)-N(1))-methyltransferase (EC [Bathymodiolus azoricus thioautotrophic gill symbiont]CAB5502211.1 tRNA (guanine(37)-N(1))-methyltransferase (EC [Bathymodiolus thermophilus thioautotrophic gill symbiont]CAC9485962.1 tRNA (guanine(37)-N(1))-methyltransferase (EC 2.1.1.